MFLSLRNGGCIIFVLILHVISFIVTVLLIQIILPSLLHGVFILMEVKASFSKVAAKTVNTRRDIKATDTQHKHANSTQIKFSKIKNQCDLSSNPTDQGNYFLRPLK